MDSIRYFKLANKGAFVTRIYVNYRLESEKEWKKWKPSGYSDICAAAERTQDLKELGIPDGTHVRLLAYVALGHDNESDEEFLYVSSSGETASYQISGTTLSNKLHRV